MEFINKSNLATVEKINNSETIILYIIIVIIIITSVIISIIVYNNTRKIKNLQNDSDLIIDHDERLRVLSTRVDTIENELNNSESVAGLTVRVNRIDEDLTKSMTNITSLQTDNAELSTRVGNNETDINEIKTTTEQLQTNVDDFKVTIDTVEKVTLPAIDGRVTTNTNDITALKTKITTIETDLGTTNTTVKTLNETVSGFDTRIKSIEDDAIPSMNGRITTNTDNINILQTKVTDVENKLTTVTETLETINIDDLTKRVETIETITIPSIDERLIANVTNVNTLTTKVSTIEDNVNKLQSDNITINDKIATNETEINKLKNDNTTMNNKITTNEASIMSLKESDTQQTSDIISLQTSVNGSLDRITINETDIIALKTTDTKFDERITMNEDSLKSHGIRLDTNEASITKINEDVTTLTSNLKTLTDTVAVNETTLKSHTTDIESLKLSMTDMETVTTILKDDIDQTKKDVTAINENLKQTDDRILAIDTTVNKQQTQLEDMDFDISVIQDNITALQEDVSINTDYIAEIGNTLNNKVDVYDPKHHLKLSILHDPIPISQFLVANDSYNGDIVFGINLTVDLVVSEFLSRTITCNSIHNDNLPWVTNTSSKNDNRLTWTSKYTTLIKINRLYNKAMFVGLSKRAYVLTGKPIYKEDVQQVENTENYEGSGSCFIVLSAYNILLNRYEIMTFIFVGNKYMDRVEVYNPTDYVNPMMLDEMYIRAFTTVQLARECASDELVMYNIFGNVDDSIVKASTSRLILGEFGCQDINQIIQTAYTTGNFGSAPTHAIPSIIDYRYGYGSMYGLAMNALYCDTVTIHTEQLELPTNNRMSFFADISLNDISNDNVPQFIVDGLKWLPQYYNTMVTTTGGLWRRTEDNLYQKTAPTNIDLQKDPTMVFVQREFNEDPLKIVNKVNTTSEEPFSGDIDETTTITAVSDLHDAKRFKSY